MPTATIHEVAKEAGVSIATVSYVLNGSRRVSEETRQRVLEATHRLGYRPNITARNLQASETRLLGYSWRPSPPDQFNPILDRFLQATAEAAERHGYRILTFPTGTIDEEATLYEDLIRVGQVDGFVLSNTNLDDVRIRRLMDLGFRFVAFGRSNPSLDFPWVDIDGTEGIRLVMQHLIEMGHQRIGCLAWPEASLTGHYRLAGYREALESHGLPLDGGWIARCENTHDEAYDMAGRLLKLPAERRPTAIVTMSDIMATGAINAAWDAELQPGRDVAVTGFDDAPIARFLRPSLTSLHQPLGEVGERLVTMLVDLCQGRPVPEPHVILSPRLVVRESSMRCTP